MDSAQKCLIFWKKRGRRRARIVTNYGGSKILRTWEPYYFQYGRALWEGFGGFGVEKFPCSLQGFPCFRNPEKGAFAKVALRKFAANCAPNLRKIAGISFRTSEEGCAKLSQICREFESKFRTILCKYLRSAKTYILRGTP